MGLIRCFFATRIAEALNSYVFKYINAERLQPDHKREVKAWVYVLVLLKKCEKNAVRSRPAPQNLEYLECFECLEPCLEQNPCKTGPFPSSQPCGVKTSLQTRLQTWE